jgi:multidrug efflux system membrane fusion protein
VIPSAAVQRGPNGNYVYVVKQDKTVENRAVNIALSQGLISQVASGVNPNEVVVIDGQDKLQPGSQVEPHMQTGGHSGDGAQSVSTPATAPGPAGAKFASQGKNRQGNAGPPAPHRRNAGGQNTGTAPQ